MSDDRKLLLLETLDPETKSRWLDYWSMHSHASWRQHPACGHLGAALGARTIYAVGILNEKVALVGAFSYRSFWRGFGGTEAVCLRGPVFDDVSFAQWCLPQISNYFRLLKVGSVRIGPNWRFPEAEETERSLFGLGFLRFEQNHPLGRRSTGIIDLCRSEEELLGSFKKSTRYEIKHAKNLGINYRLATNAREAIEFFNALDKRDKERGIGRMPSSESEAIVELLIRDGGLGAILCAYHDNTFLGGLLIVRGGKTASTSKFVVSEISKRLFPTLRLAPSVFFEGMRWARAQGCESIDLEGYSANDQDLSDLAFVNRYKAGFNPLPCQTLGQYYAVCHCGVHRVHSMLALGRRVARWPKRVAYRIGFELKRRLVERRERRALAVLPN